MYNVISFLLAKFVLKYIDLQDFGSCFAICNIREEVISGGNNVI